MDHSFEMFQDEVSHEWLIQMVFAGNQQNNVKMTEIALDSFVKYILVSMNRMQHHFRIQDKKTPSAEISSATQTIIDEYADKIEKQFKIKFDAMERTYLAIQFSSRLSSDSYSQYGPNFIIMGQIDELVFRMLNTIYETFSLDFRNNLELRMSLNQHLVPMDIRIRYNIRAENPLLERHYKGIQAYGGASVLDYMTASIVGTAFAVISGKGVEFGIGLAVPVALLMIQLDILARFFNVFFQKRIDSAVEEMNISKIKFYHFMGIFSWGLSRGLPIFIVFCFGENIVKLISDIIPSWLTGGLSIAGGMLPAVGIAILLRYLPIKNYVGYLIIGFVAVAYLSVPMFGVTLLGFAMAIIQYKKMTTMPVTLSSENNVSAGGIDDDEYED